MTAAQIEAALNHAFADAEAVLAAVGKSDLNAELERVKTFVESPLALEILAAAISFGFGKLGLDATDAQAAEQPSATPANSTSAADTPSA